MILTGKQIIDLANIAGISVDDNCLGDDEKKTEFQVFEDKGKIYAMYHEYPEEGSAELEKI